MTSNSMIMLYYGLGAFGLTMSVVGSPIAPVAWLIPVTGIGLAVYRPLRKALQDAGLSLVPNVVTKATQAVTKAAAQAQAEVDSAPAAQAKAFVFDSVSIKNALDAGFIGQVNIDSDDMQISSHVVDAVVGLFRGAASVVRRKPISIAVVGETGVGKRHLANLLAKGAYGASSTAATIEIPRDFGTGTKIADEIINKIRDLATERPEQVICLRGCERLNQTNAAPLTEWLTKVFGGEQLVTANISSTIFVCSATKEVALPCLPDDKEGWKDNCFNVADGVFGAALATKVDLVEVLLPLDDFGKQMIAMHRLNDLAHAAGFAVSADCFDDDNVLIHVVGTAGTNAKTIRDSCDRQTKSSLQALQAQAAAMGTSGKPREVKYVLRPHSSGGQSVVAVFADDAVINSKTTAGATTVATAPTSQSVASAPAATAPAASTAPAGVAGGAPVSKALPAKNPDWMDSDE